MITIDQLLESVNLDFEPRFVTKGKLGEIWFWGSKPYINPGDTFWSNTIQENKQRGIGCLKIAEFADKDWQECIYEVPQKEEPKIKIGTLYVTFGDGDDDDVGFAQEDYEVPRKTMGKIEKIHIPEMDEVAESAMYSKELTKRLNQIIDAVNELKSNN